MPRDVADVLADIDRALNYTTHREARDDAARDQERAAVQIACLERCAPPGSAYRRRTRELLQEGHALSVHLYQALLQALRSDVQDGRLGTFEELVHAELFSDFLSQARYLSDAGHRRAASVVAGGALEEHLRQLALRNGVATTGPRGNPRNAAALNAALYKAGGYSKAEHAQVDAWQKIRNDAAHADPDFETNYTPADVRRMCDGIADFLVKYPA